MDEQSKEKAKSLDDIASWYCAKNGHKSDWSGLQSALTRFGFRKAKEHFRDDFIHKGNVLEVGIADGQMTGLLCSCFSRVVGVDGSASFIEAAEDIFKEKAMEDKVDLVHSLIEDFNTKERFDVVLLMHLLEHVDDPVGILKKCGEFLKEDGFIFALVPNANSLHRLMGVEMGLLKSPHELNQTDLLLGHKRVYYMESFIEDIRNAGLRIMKSGGLFLKQLANSQIEQTWNEKMIEAAFVLGEKYPEIAAEVYAVCMK